MIKKLNPTLILPILILATALLITVFYASAMKSAVKGHIPTVGMDTLIYYQHARNWAEGHPYVYNPGDGPSTGSTSHLYPIILSGLYLMGCTGNKLITAGFFLNALLLLSYLLAMWGIIKRLFPQAAMQLFTFALLATNGHLIFHFLVQGDMGLFTMTTGIAFFCLLSKRYVFLSILTLLLPFVRPEGVVINIATASACLFLSNKEKKISLLPVLTGLLGALGLFALNYSLTGRIGFDSTWAKGFMYNEGLWFGARSILSGTMNIMTHLFSGVIHNSQSFFILPVIGLIAILISIVSTSRDNDRQNTPLIMAWSLSILGALPLLAMGETAFVHCDRYFTWIYPILILLQVSGIQIIAEQYKKSLIPLLLLVALFSVSSLPDLLNKFQIYNSIQASSLQKMDRLAQMLPPGTKIVANGECELKYFCPQLYTINLKGIDYAPLKGLADRGNVLEAWREGDCPLPEVVLITAGNRMDDFMPLLENRQEIPGIYLDEAWNLYSVNSALFSSISLSPLNSNVLSQIENCQTVSSLNIGHQPQERRFHYRAYSGLPNEAVFLPAITTNTLNGITFADTVRPVAGVSTFQLPAQPHQRAILILRLIKQGSFALKNTSYTTQVNLSAEKENLRVSINNARPFVVEQSFGTNGVIEIALDIPPEQITSPQLSVKLSGLHIVAAAWAYQPKITENPLMN